MIDPILIATTNPGKVREIALILEGLPHRFRTLAGQPPIEEPEESGATFEDNAAIKARYYARVAGVPAVAEDSGLAIDALDGRPGIHSARYPGATYPERFARLYRELAPHPRPWTARYVCALMLAAPDGRLLFETRATVQGEIAPAPHGSGGFGYDPIFHYPPYGTTLAAVDDARKLAVAHRGQAFRALRAWLREDASR